MSHEIRTMLDERAAALSMTRSRYGALVLAWWYRQGCPAVTQADQAMQELKGLRAAEKSQSAYSGRRR